MAFVIPNQDRVLSEMVSNLIRNTNITRLDSAGSKARYLLKTVNDQLGTTYFTLESNMRDMLLSSAEGPALDFLADAFTGIRRIEERVPTYIAANRAFLIYTDASSFGDINDDQTIFIPAGTALHDGNPDSTLRVNYLLTEDIRLPPDKRTVYVGATALNSDARNNIPPNTIRHIEFAQYTKAADRRLKVINELPLDGATPRESDINFKYRIANESRFNQKGNLTALRMAALSVPGVANVQIDPYVNGIGTADVVIQSTSPVTSIALLSAVQRQLDDVAPLGSRISARSPQYFGIEITVSLFYKDAAAVSNDNEIRNRVSDALLTYFNNLGLGEDFIYNEIVNIIFQADSRITDIGRAGDPIDSIIIYKPSKIFSEKKIPERIKTGFSLPTPSAKIVPEPSLLSPIIIKTGLIGKRGSV